MTKEEALALMSKNRMYCAIHNRMKTYPDVAFYFDNIAAECFDCNREARIKEAEAMALLGTRT